MSTGDIIVLAVIALVIVAAVLIIVHDHRSGKCACGRKECGGCCNCVEIEDEKNDLK